MKGSLLWEEQGLGKCCPGKEIFIWLEVWLEADLSIWRSDWDWAVCNITVQDWRIQQGEGLEE